MNSTSFEKSQSPVSGFCCARNRVCNAVFVNSLAPRGEGRELFNAPVVTSVVLLRLLISKKIKGRTILQPGLVFLVTQCTLVKTFKLANHHKLPLLGLSRITPKMSTFTLVH